MWIEVVSARNGCEKGGREKDFARMGGCLQKWDEEGGGVDRGGVDRGGVDSGGVDRGGVDWGGVTRGEVSRGGWC